MSVWSESPLPIDSYLSAIAEGLKRSGALVLIGPPGCGKTTRVPPAILDSALRSPGRVVLLQPRRIAARAAAAWIAAERGGALGQEVGYTVRFENRTTRDTRIQVVTEGILTRRLQDDPFLEGISAVIVDEFHERSIHADLAIALIREIRRAGRDDLLLLVMSATLDPAPVSRFLDDCPIVRVEGRPYPVEVRHLDVPRREVLADLPRAAAGALKEAWATSKHHALVFLPGIAEIRRAARELEAFAESCDALLVPLHGGLSLQEQQLALDPSDRRKIILSTNIAETSLTIDGVDLVIDGGFAKILRNDPRHGIDRLEVSRISRYSAEQRAGRAGRLGPGTAVRLWSHREHETLAESEAPEIRRVDLASTVLELRAWGTTDPREFEWYEPPAPDALARAEGLLESLGAVAEEHGPLTDVGRAMLRIPAHPRIARVLIAADESDLLEDAALLAALIEERDIISISAGRVPLSAGRAPVETGPSDLLERLDRFREVETRRFRVVRDDRRPVDAGACRAVARARDALLRSVHRSSQRKKTRSSGERDDDALLRLLLLGWPDRVARRRAPGSERGRMVGGRGVVLAPESVVRDAPFFLAVEIDEGARGGGSDARVRVASAVRREWIERDLAPWVRDVVETVFDPATEKVRSTATRSYRDLPLEDPRERRPPAEESERLLAQAVRERAEEIVAADPAPEAWLLRARSLAVWMPELGIPDLDAAFLGDVLASACSGRVSVDEVRGANVLGLLQAAVGTGTVSSVERYAPETIQVPSGNRIRLRYELGRPPVLAVRLQEVFGLSQTPTVAAGRVAVLLHILGPNFRPVQITQDLRSFWNTTYAQVRKDLRARYPKHAWPEDPWTAAPRTPGRRRRK